MTDRTDRNSMEYWGPKLVKIGVPMPETLEVATGYSMLQFADIVDGKIPDDFEKFINRMQQAGDQFGFPCFMRTGHYSGKHGWDGTCFVRNRQSMPQGIVRLIDESFALELPLDHFYVRKFESLEFAGFCAFGGAMPISRERRYFAVEGAVTCHHPYWVEDAIDRWYKSMTELDEMAQDRIGAEGNPRIIRVTLPDDWKERLATINHEPDDEVLELTKLATVISREFKGYWSIDFAKTVDGRWLVIDMAEAEESYHVPGCEFAGKTFVDFKNK